MSSPTRQILARHRPSGHTGRGDRYLAELAQDLRRLLAQKQRTFAHDSCRLPEADLNELAALLVELGEDLHNDIGLWRALESFNRSCFGQALPLTTRAAGPAAGSVFDRDRTQHFLWGLWSSFKPDLLVSPTHTDLRALAEAASSFLAERFPRLPQDSGVGHFLGSPNRYGWDVKRKLVWLGTHSYLFRLLYPAYVAEHGAQATVATTDDFICQACTCWSGLGAIDILAGALDLPDADRATLRGWYERHAAFFRVLSRQDQGGQTETIEVRNLINDQSYTVRMDMPDCPFRSGGVIFGSLVPWRGEWYWSGEQRQWPDLSPAAEADVRKRMLQESSAITYRYCPERAELARKSIARHYARFQAYYGNDLVVFPDGLSAAAAEQKKMTQEWEAAPPEVVAQFMKASGLTRPCPAMHFPKGFLDCDQGVGCFFNPDEGEEFMQEFDPVLSGFKKRGVGLTPVELERIRQFMESPAISPAFVQRLVRDHGAESVGVTYAIKDFQAETDLSFLLRRHKGHFYRRRYPTLALVSDAG